MKFRRSRCITVAISAVLIVVVMLGVAQQFGAAPPARDLAELGRALFRPKQNTYNFNAWADALFEKWLAQADAADARFMQYVLGHNIAETSDEPIAVGVSQAGTLDSHTAVFDPRYTLGVVVAELSRQLAAGTQPDQLAMPAFHWADWTDCSVHEQAALSRDVRTCEVFRAKGSPSAASQKDVVYDPYRYCYDDTEQGRESEAAARAKADFSYVDGGTDSVAAGYHVFAYPGRTTSEDKKAASAAYLWEFMPAPSGVVMLGVGGESGPGPVHVTCGSAPRRRLAAVPAGEAAAKSGRISLGAEVAHLAGALGSAAGSAGDAAGAAVSEPQVELQHEDFVDQSAAIVESADAEPADSREAAYLAALRMSLATENPVKYFHEAKLVRREKNWALGSHYDWRFFKGLRANSATHAPILHGLISAWLRFAHAQRVRTWLAHGTLLGWFWNGASFPWDADIDVQMPVADLHRLARRFNRTVVVDFGPAPHRELRMGRYLLDIGPWLSHRDPGSGQNSIDARFIDLDSGLYIDITALAVSSVPSPERYGLNNVEDIKQIKAEVDRAKKDREARERNGLGSSPETPETANVRGRLETPEKSIRKHLLEKNAAAALYNCRNKHFSSLSELSPLRLTHMEGVPAYVPQRFLPILHTEYSFSSTEKERFKSYSFLPRLRIWVATRVLSKYTREKAAADVAAASGPLGVVDMADFLGADRAAAQRKDRSYLSLSDEDYLRIMAAEPGILHEYLATRDYTAAHEAEMQAVLAASRDPATVVVPELSMRRDLSVFVRAQTGWSYEEAVAQLAQQVAARDSDPETSDPKTSDPKISGSDAKTSDLGPAMVFIPKPAAAPESPESGQRQRESDPVNIGGVESSILKQAEADARDPSITRPDRE